jgi:hypothetical protein
MPYAIFDEGATLKTVILAIFIFGAFITGAFGQAAATAQKACYANVIEIKGTCYAYQDGQEKKQITVGDRLLQGQNLELAESAEMKIKFNDTGAEQTIKTSTAIPNSAPLGITDLNQGSRAGRNMGSKNSPERKQ